MVVKMNIALVMMRIEKFCRENRLGDLTIVRQLSSKSVRPNIVVQLQ